MKLLFDLFPVFLFFIAYKMYDIYVATGEELPMTDGWTIKDTLEHALDAVLDGGFSGFEPTTIIDFTEEEPVLVRQGQGAFSQ